MAFNECRNCLQYNGTYCALDGDDRNPDDSCIQFFLDSTVESESLRSVEKCCYTDIEKICIHPVKEFDAPMVCKTGECNYYYEGEWYFPERTRVSQQKRIKK